MAEYPFVQVDAFTNRRLAGNPCAIIFDADDLDDTTMQAIARENNLSETAFVRRSEAADFGVRYFTPAEEVPLAGHPTIATIWALIESERAALADELTTITLELKVGPISVDITSTNGRVQIITMNQMKPHFLRRYDPQAVLPAFGLSLDDQLPEAPIQTVSTGTPQLMIPLRDRQALRRAQLDMPACTLLKESGDFFSPHLFCLEGFTPAGRTSARHFGLPPDTFEDPFTGSATGGMAAYLWHHGLIDDPRFVAEQGHCMNRPGVASVEVVGSRDDIEAVRVGGTAVTVIRGVIQI